MRVTTQRLGSACLWLALLCPTARLWGTAEIDFSARFRASPVLPNLVDETLIYRAPLWYGTKAELGVRLIQDSSDLLRGLEYKGELEYSPLPWVSLLARLRHQNDFPETLSSTHLAAILKTQLEIFYGATVFGSVGWRRRYVLLQKSAPLPTFRSSYTEHDLVGAFGLETRWRDDLRVRLLAGNWDEFSEYNLQHPFLQIEPQLEIIGGALVARVFYRYQVLLGFGRLSEWALGAGIRMALLHSDAEASDYSDSP